MYLSQFNNIFLVSHVFMFFLTNVSAQHFYSAHFDCAKEFAFRKSGNRAGKQSQNVGEIREITEKA